MSVVLAIDQGTSGTKAAVIDETGAVVASAERLIRPDYLADGGVEQDPEALLASVLEVGRRALTEAGLEVGTVALANQGESVLAWDPGDGRPLSPVIGWQDRRAEPIRTELAGSRAWIEQRTGLVLDPYFSAPKLAWLRQNRTRDGVVTTTDSWLLHRLTGAFVTDAATASRSLITDLKTGAWDRDLLEAFGLEDERLPEIVACDTTVGSTDAFGAQLDVGGLIVDQQAALLGQGCLRAGEAKCTFGTGAFLLVQAGVTPTRSAAGLSASIAWRARGRTAYCLDGQVYALASAVRWLQRLGFVRRPSDLDRVAAGDSGGVIAVPALAGLGAPRWRPDAAAAIHGMTLATEPGHLVRAVLEGIAAQIAELVKVVAIDLGQPLDRLRVDGGLTRSRTLMQAVADLTQLEIEVYPHANATLAGAAALARLAEDPGLDLSDAVPTWSANLRYAPRWSAEQTADFRGRWSELADGL